MPKSEYVIFHRCGTDPFTEVGRSYATTGREAIAEWLDGENDECPLAACDVAAVAAWGFYREHYDPR